MTKKVIVSDIDGTLLDHGKPTPGLDSLGVIISSAEEEIKLVYATGRSFQSTWSLVLDGILPRPDAVAAFVGTELWLPPWASPDHRFRSHILRDWNRSRVVTLAEQYKFRALEMQPEEFQTPQKVSYFVEDPVVVEELRETLRESALRCRLVYSGNRFLDVLPERAGKKAVIDFLLELWQIPASQVLVSGDSGNDLDMLTADRLMGVAVGNAKEEVREAAEDGDSETLHQAQLPHAAGVLEGAEAFDFWNGNDEKR